MINKINKMINKKIVNVNWIIKWKACIPKNKKKKQKIDAIIIVWHHLSICFLHISFISIYRQIIYNIYQAHYEIRKTF
jgi:hypothetical protein